MRNCKEASTAENGPAQITSLRTKLCILVLAVEWLLFGLTHFIYHNAATEEIPSYIPFADLIVTITGMAEVATGIMILFPKTRRFAALTSLVLLLLFLPSIFYMLVDDAAISSFPWPKVVRVLLVPNHILLALCASYLLRSPEPNRERPSEPSRGLAPILRSVLNHQWKPARNGTLIIASVMLFANIAGFGEILLSPWHRPPAIFWGMMCLAVGALVGFLFGVPKLSLAATEHRTHVPNSNIEVLSDWLTKIIVGVGLVEFHRIWQFLQRESLTLSKALCCRQSGHTEDEAVPFAKALIVYFFVCGMIQGYLLTRMYLSEQFKIKEALNERSAGAKKTIQPSESSQSTQISQPPDPPGTASRES